jgi:hypothetical protein
MLVASKMTRSVCALLCALAIAWPAVTHAEETDWDKRFHTQVQQWMNTIIERDPSFRDWKNARIDAQSLGANQHQWLVSITRDGRQVGYMVVGESPASGTQPTFVLLEYGVGEYILFDDAFAPRAVAAEPVYDGFASHWLVARQEQRELVDAKTGETYPASAVAGPPVITTLSEAELVRPEEVLTAARVLSGAVQDPFDRIDWLTDTSNRRQLTWTDLWQKTSAGPVTLTVPLHHSNVLAPFAVQSLHLWNGRAAYVGVWDEGLRFVPYAYAMKVGQFHAVDTGAHKTSSLPE